MNATPSAAPSTTTSAAFGNGSRIADAAEGTARPAPANRSRPREDAALAVMLARASSDAASPLGGTAAPSPASAPGAPTVTMEALLQSAWSVGQGLRPAGYGELEFRVRLGGASEEVTVRVHVASDRVLVSFQTKSPALRRSLEQGWKQLGSGGGQPTGFSPSETPPRVMRQPPDRPGSPINDTPLVGRLTVSAVSQPPGSGTFWG